MNLRPTDPIYYSARREALVVLCIWLAAFAWTIGYSALYGYRPEPNPPTVFGVPSWVMWGIFAPWTVCTIASLFVSSVLMKDEDLGEDPDEKRSEHEAARELGDG